MKYFLSCLSFLALASCQNSDDAYSERPVEELYKEAMENLESGNFTKSAKEFSEVERQHPYSNWSIKAQIMAGYGYYQAKKYDEAVESFQVFIGLHPMHPQVAYAYYMIGMCYYEQIPIVHRDQKLTEKALNAFNEVLSRFQETDFAKDARFKIDFLKDHLAGKEMEVGRFYQQQNNHLAAVNRFKGVVDTYQTTSHAPEALHRMVECYLNLGLIDQAQATAAVLGHNYPGSTWYQATYDLLKNKNISFDLKKGAVAVKK